MAIIQLEDSVMVFRLEGPCSALLKSRTEQDPRDSPGSSSACVADCNRRLQIDVRTRARTCKPWR